MPAVVKIKPGKYGTAIGLLLERGGACQTRHERTLIVSGAPKKALQAAGLIETNGAKEGQRHAHKKTPAERFPPGAAAAANGTRRRCAG